MTDAARKLPALLRAAEVLADRLDAAGDRGRPIGARLRASVVGPLQPVAGGDTAQADPAPGSQLAEFTAAELPAEAVARSVGAGPGRHHAALSPPGSA